MATWFEIHFYYECVICSISLCLNFVLILLCRYHLGYAFKSYRWMLIGGACVDVTFTIVSFSTQMLAIDYESTMAFMVPAPFLPQTHRTAVIGTILFCLVSYTMIVNVCCQFLYRLNIFYFGNRYSLKEVFGLAGLLELWVYVLS
ncbi:hypothetical protein M3Y99_00150400 [Aphelenchoides fujianensis]|nr:hypothetical protein M3Y99_00150400 [Aphelenchoides fujianensis]